jgi:CheY-like chemotaxis protein
MEALGTLTGGISHEFNNILQSIIGYGDILRDALKDDALRTYADVILSSAQKAAGLTQGLLAYSSKQIIDRKLISLNEIMKKVEGLLSRFIGEDINLRVIPADNDLIVNADSNQIEQVLMNLAINAKDAMPQGGVLTIRLEHAVMEEEFIRTHGYGEAGMYALISAKDTGIGMDEKTRSRIFEPFFTTKEIGKGTGLGLSMVYGIVKAHNGYIDVRSAPGEGTTFNVYIPAIKVDIERAQSFTEPPPKGGAETVLVAEDDTEVRKLIGALLEKAGYKVIQAVDGEDAVEKMRENKDRIQLLLCDVVMPKKNGREAFDEILKMKPHIRALFISGYTDDIIHEKGILAEGLHFISKPILPKELLGRVRDILDA